MNPNHLFKLHVTFGVIVILTIFIAYLSVINPVHASIPTEPEIVITMDDIAKIEDTIKLHVFHYCTRIEPLQELAQLFVEQMEGLRQEYFALKYEHVIGPLADELMEFFESLDICKYESSGRPVFELTVRDEDAILVESIVLSDYLTGRIMMVHTFDKNWQMVPVYYFSIVMTIG